MVKLNKLIAAQQEYEKIIEINPETKAAKLAVIGISKIQEFLIQKNNYNSNYTAIGSTSNKTISKSNNIDTQKAKNSYIDNAVNERGEILRWENNKMPLKIYISSQNSIEGFKSSYIQEIKEACAKWVSASNGFLKTNFVSNKNSADIKISFKPNLQPKKNANEFISGLTTPYYDGRKLGTVQIRFATLRPDGTSQTNEDIFNTSIHEFGHALGIWGHSSVQGDVMYPVRIVDGEVKKKTLSLRDKNTIQTLYELNPNEINSDNSAKNNILGNKRDRLEKKLVEAKRYTKEIPNKAISWSQLGRAYLSLGNYNDAVKNFNKALTFDSTFKDARLGLAELYTNTNKLDKAIAEYKKVLTYNPDDIIVNKILAEIYIRNNQKNLAKKVLNDLIIKDSSVKNDSGVKKLLKQI